MTFEDILARILEVLQHEKRISYRALKRRFDLDDDSLEDVKEELIYAKHLARDEEGRVLVWHADAAPALTSVSAPAPAGEQERAPLSYIPQHLAEKILTSRSALEGERKQVTVMFADIKDSTELIKDLDPEAAQQLLDPALHRMMDAVHRYEGTVNQVLGDGIMALFGAPLAHEDHAIRACYAALAMQAAMRDYSEEVRHNHGIEVRIRVGLNSGEVVVRTISNDLHMDYSAVGQTTHLAARMEQLATPGSIRLAAATLRLVEGLVRVNTLGPVPVKGVAEPMDILELVGVIPFPRRLQASAVRGLTPFVGREAELEVLYQAQARAGAGHGQVVAAVGEAGVGKSRLVYEFVHSHRTQGWLVLESASASYAKATPYFPVVDLLKRYVHVESHDQPHTIRAKITGHVLALDETLQDTIPALLALLDAQPEDDPFQRLAPQQRRQRTLNALKRILLRESQVQPLVLLFEDLHWMDSETQALFDGLVESLPTVQLLLLVNYRPEYQHTWGSRAYYTEVQLDPLPPISADAFLQVLLGDDPSSEPLKQLLIAHTEGNPFFLEESIQTLVETGALVGERGAYRLAKTLPTIQVPATVQAVLAARIDRLPFEEKRLLQCAAVIGKQVPFVLLQIIAELPEDGLRRGLIHLQTADFLYETRLLPELEYTFKHVLTYAVAYRSLLERHRRAYHAAVGIGLEKLFAGRIDEVLELLAHHFGRSAEDEKAVDYAILAAEKAQHRWANTEALVHFDTALEHLKAMPDTGSNRLRRIDAVLKQAEVKVALGRHAEHIVALEGIHDVVESAADPWRRATWYYWIGFLHSFIGSRPEVAIAYCSEASAIAEVGGFDEIRAFAEACLAQVYVFAGDLQGAVAVGERALATFEARRNIWWACRTLWQLSTAANALGEWKQSLEYCHRAVEHGQAVDDLRLKVVGWYRTGSTHIQRGDPKTGLQCCEEALALSPIPYDTAMIKAIRGHGLVKVGEAAAGTAELAEAVAWFDRSHLRYTRSVFALRLAEAHLRQGERLRARAIFEEVLAASREAGYRHREGVAQRLLGESLAVEDPVAASEHLESATRILQEVGARNEVAKALVAQADLCQAAGDEAAARDLFERALALFEALGTLEELSRVRAVLAALARRPSA